MIFCGIWDSRVRESPPGDSWNKPWLSWILALLICSLLNTHLSIRSIRSFQESSSLHIYLYSTTILLTIPQTFSHSTKHDSNLLTLAILFHLWHLLVFQSYTLLFRLFLKFKLFRSRNISPPECPQLIATKLPTGNPSFWISIDLQSSNMLTLLEEF